jgi:FtsP/CotA-like multicopper oxidase with cupredoxin domain
MPKKYALWLIAILVAVLATAAFFLLPSKIEPAGINPPATTYKQSTENSSTEKPCLNEHPEWRAAQEIEDVKIEASHLCEPDNPYDVAVAVKGTNNVSMMTLMQTHFAQDALTMGKDLDGDGDPDEIHIKLEVVELNGATPDSNLLINTFDVAPGIQPALWVFAPKSSGMALKNFNSMVANPLLRAPSPTIRVEQGDKVFITLENIHYLPHTIHLHGVDHPWMNSKGEDNDGMEEHAVFPGKQHTYEIQPRHTGTMLYHCHVQTAQHMSMGMGGMFIIEENRPNNWVQTFNIGAGQVRHPSVAVKEKYSQEYDLHYQAVDKSLENIVQTTHDPRLVAERMTRQHNITESHENYFLLNGRSFPYTLRDATIIADENENIMLHVANLQRSSIALHTHGHKVTEVAHDGVEAPAGLQMTRDVIDIAPAQRVDIALQTKNDGLHSYGAGVWMYHDHVPQGASSDGIEPGGNIALIIYKSLVDEQGMPKGHVEMFDQVFSKDYYAKKQAVWGNNKEFAALLGDAGLLAPNYVRIIIFAIALGVLIALLLVGLRLLKRKSS